MSFIFENLHGKDILVQTDLPVPFKRLTLPMGQTYNITLKAPTNDLVRFEAFERDSGKRVAINGDDVFHLLPQESLERMYILSAQGESPSTYFLNVIKNLIYSYYL